MCWDTSGCTSGTDCPRDFTSGLGQKAAVAGGKWGPHCILCAGCKSMKEEAPGAAGARAVGEEHEREGRLQ